MPGGGARLRLGSLRGAGWVGMGDKWGEIPQIKQLSPQAGGQVREAARVRVRVAWSRVREEGGGSGAWAEGLAPHAGGWVGVWVCGWVGGWVDGWGLYGWVPPSPGAWGSREPRGSGGLVCVSLSLLCVALAGCGRPSRRLRVSWRAIRCKSSPPCVGCGLYATIPDAAPAPYALGCTVRRSAPPSGCLLFRFIPYYKL